MNALAFFEYLGNSSVFVPVVRLQEFPFVLFPPPISFFLQQKYTVRKSHFTPRCASLRFITRKWKFPCWRGESLPVYKVRTEVFGTLRVLVAQG